MKTWHQYMEDRLAKREPDVPWELRDKLVAYSFLDDIGVDHARVLGLFESPEEIEFDKLPRNFVVKPTREDSMRGVLVLSRRKDCFYDELRAREWTEAQIKAELRDIFKRNSYKENQIVVEEYLRDSDGFDVPRDFKFYAFRGEVALVLEIDRNTRPHSVSWYDSGFNPIIDDRIRVNSAHSRHIPGRRPAAWREMLSVAEVVSRNLQTPFASIDLYSSSRGPLVGEITLTPGGLYYGAHKMSHELEMMMGAKWAIAEKSKRLFVKEA